MDTSGISRHLFLRLGWSEFPTSHHCVLWPGPAGSNGYGKVKHRRVTYSAHRAMWCAFNRRDVPAGLHVMHSCDNKMCVNPGHLGIGTAADNNLDKTVKGRQARGESIGRGKLNPNAVLGIRSMCRTGKYNLSEIGFLFGVHPGTVSDVLNGVIWGHVPPPTHEGSAA